MSTSLTLGYLSGNEKVVRPVQYIQEISSSLSFSPAPIIATAAACGLVVNGYMGSWIHEQGHAIAMRTCFRDVSPVTVVRWFGAGATFPLGGSVPTALGSCLGERKVKLLIAAGGVLATTATATFFSVISHAFPHSLIGHALTWTAFWQVSREVVHILQYGPDFVEIRKYGGPPRLAIAVILVALPLLTSLFCSWTRCPRVRQHLPQQ